MASCFFSTLTFSSTPLERFLLINDFEAWLNNGKSYFDWSEYRDKNIKIHPDIKQPVQVYIDFNRNQIAAEEKYQRVIQKVSGHISKIERNHRGEPLVVFNVGHFDKIYVNGLTINEVIKLKTSDKVNLLCVGFKMDSVGDISATCSMFNDPARFIAVNNIQLLDKQNQLNLNHKNKVEFNKILGLYTKTTNQKFNQECSFIDSKNYAVCLQMLDETLKNKAP